MNNAASSGERLRAFRKSAGLTLRSLADTVGCTKAYVWELEAKPGQRPSAERVIGLDKALRVTVCVMGEPNPWPLGGAGAEDRKFVESYLKLSQADRRRMRRILAVIEEC